MPLVLSGSTGITSDNITSLVATKLTGQVPNSALAGSGTADATSFLRGDRAWQAITQKVANVSVLQNSTRASCPSSTGSTPTDMVTWTYNKLNASTNLAIYMSIAGKGDASGSVSLGIKYGSSSTQQRLMYTYQGSVHSLSVWGAGIISGYTTTGSQTLAAQVWAANGGAGERPFSILNPNSSDDGRLNQTISTAIVIEYYV